MRIFMLMICGGLALALTACATPEAESRILVDEDFREWTGQFNDPRMRMLETNLASTGVEPTPHREGQGVPQALVRNMAKAPRFEDGTLNIYRNEVGQGSIRRFERHAPRFDPDRHVVFIEQITFADAALSGTNSIGTRIWVQQGDGPNDHETRLSLSSHFNTHGQGSRQLYPAIYHVHEGTETWSMPEGNNDRRAGRFYRLAAEGRNEELHGEEAVERGIYWDWQNLEWPLGWAEPLGGALYEPDDEADAIASQLNDDVFAATAIFRRGDERIDTTGDGEADVWNTHVEIEAPRTAGRLALQGPLPRQIDEVRLLLRSDAVDDPEDWDALSPDAEPDRPLLGIARARIGITRKADFDLSGHVDGDDYAILRQHFGKDEGALMFHGDATGDGRVDIDDYFMLIEQWQEPLDESDRDTDGDEAQWHVEINRDSGEVRLVPRSPEAQLLGFDIEAEGDGAFDAEAVEHPFPDDLYAATGGRISGGALVPAAEPQALGEVVADSDELGQLRFRYVSDVGGPVREGPVVLID